MKNAQEEQQKMIPKIVWGALFVSQLLYLFILSQNGASTELSSASLVPIFSNPIHLVFVVMALAAITVGWVIPKMMIKAFKKKKALQGAQSPQSFSELLKIAFVPLIFRLALFESASLFGFVLASQEKSLALMLPFSLVSILCFLKNFPTESFLRNFVEEA